MQVSALSGEMEGRFGNLADQEVSEVSDLETRT